MLFPQVSKKYVSKDVAQKIHDKAAPFIKWLKEAEEESESSEGDDMEVRFDDKEKISKIKVEGTSDGSTKKDPTPELKEKSEEKSADEEDEDEVDIDNI